MSKRKNKKQKKRNNFSCENKDLEHIVSIKDDENREVGKLSELSDYMGIIGIDEAINGFRDDEVVEIKEQVVPFVYAFCACNSERFLDLKKLNFVQNKSNIFDIYSKDSYLKRNINTDSIQNKITNNKKSFDPSNFKFDSNLFKNKNFAIIIGIILICVSLFGFTYKNAYNVYVGQNLIGIIEKPTISEEKFQKEIQDTVIAKIQSELGANIDINEEIALTAINVAKQEINSLDYILNNISKNITYKVQGAQIVVDGEPKILVISESSAKKILDDILDSHKKENLSINSAEFVQDVKIENVFVDKEEIVSDEKAIGTLTSMSETESLYKIKSGDSLFGIALKNNISLPTLLKINPSINENSILKIGQELNLVLPMPLLSVRTIEQATYTEVVKRPIETIENNKEYKTYRKVIKTGADGEKTVTANVAKVNGIEESRTVVSETIVVQPVKETVEVGTLQTPPKRALGSFVYPLSGGQLSSKYGTRWNRVHKGIDISASKGTPVKASDGGTVTFAGWRSDYGYMVKISHNNGFETVYAHNSKLAVSVGDRVAQGTVISYVGSTGRSTGNHLHFEVIKNGVNKNPLSYIK